MRLQADQNAYSGTLLSTQTPPPDPCRQLWLSVLTCAIKDALGMGVTDSTKGPKHRVELQTAAQQWIRSTWKRPGSFEWVCEFLELNPATIRQAVDEASLLHGHSRKHVSRKLQAVLRP